MNIARRGYHPARSGETDGTPSSQRPARLVRKNRHIVDRIRPTDDDDWLIVAGDVGEIFEPHWVLFR